MAQHAFDVEITPERYGQLQAMIGAAGKSPSTDLAAMVMAVDLLRWLEQEMLHGQELALERELSRRQARTEPSPASSGEPSLAEGAPPAESSAATRAG